MAYRLYLTIQSTPAEEDPAPVETPDEGDEEEPVAEETIPVSLRLGQ